MKTFGDSYNTVGLVYKPSRVSPKFTDMRSELIAPVKAVHALFIRLSCHAPTYKYYGIDMQDSKQSMGASVNTFVYWAFVTPDDNFPARM